MKKDKILLGIRKSLRRNINNRYKESIQRFFKEKVKNYGVKSAAVKKIAREYFVDIKNLDKEEIFRICSELLKSGYSEEKSIAFDWLFQLKKQYQKQDFKIFEQWLNKYVSDWGDCDNFCTGAFGEFILQFPRFFNKIRIWAKSKNRWMRRASAVILIYSTRRGKFIEESLKIADILLIDEDDLVQKGYGWMLKELSNLYPNLVFRYIMKNKYSMPRTALRYAVEKLPEKLRKKAIKR
jgi:3-methyladenine DNA glycosylase AlkD